MVTDISKQKKVKQGLEKKVKKRTAELEQMNAALKVMLGQRDRDKRDLEKNFMFKLKQLVVPYLKKLQKSRLDKMQKTLVDIMDTSINDLISPLSRNLSDKYLVFTPMEIQVANLIKQGKKSKEIAQFYSVSIKTICIHRNSIRKKLGIINSKENLRTHLLRLK